MVNLAQLWHKKFQYILAFKKSIPELPRTFEDKCVLPSTWAPDLQSPFTRLQYLEAVHTIIKSQLLGSYWADKNQPKIITQGGQETTR